MHTVKASMSRQSIGNRAVQSVLIVAALAVFSGWPEAFAEPITDQQNCGTELGKAEDAIVRANIDSGTFRVLNDQLVEMRALCEKQDYSGAQTKLADVMSALKDLEKK